MKKKLLTVLLAVVMVFGVFGLTACGGPTSNADHDYNYYGMKYNLEDEVKIDAVTYQGVVRIFTTDGKFLLYVDSEQGAGAAERFQAINKLANEWDVTIYHFNPDLSGGYAKDLSNAQNANIITTLSGKAAASQLKDVQDNLTAISGKTATEWTDNALLAVTGKSPSIVSGEIKYNGKISATNSGDDAYKSILTFATKRPSYGAYTEEDGDVPTVGSAYITKVNTMNLFADSRLHMYTDEEGNEIDALTAEKKDVFVTVANYAMFAHLMDNNDGYFSVFFGGTWCGNTQAIVKLTNEVAKEKVVNKVYFFDPRLDDGVRPFKIDGENVVLNNSAYLAKQLNTRTADATSDANYNYNFLYGKFLSTYLPTYESEWNIASALEITVGTKVETYTKMCVPNIMMFNGEKSDAPAELVALAEAEYLWPSTNDPKAPEYIAWKEAVEKVFDANPWLAIEAQERAANGEGTTEGGSTEGGSTEGGSTGGGSTGGGSTGGGSTTPAPAPDAGGGC